MGRVSGGIYVLLIPNGLHLDLSTLVIKFIFIFNPEVVLISLKRVLAPLKGCTVDVLYVVALSLLAPHTCLTCIVNRLDTDVQNFEVLHS